VRGTPANNPFASPYSMPYTHSVQRLEMETPDDNRRQSPRIKVKVPFELYIDGSTSPIRGATADLSLTGCYIETIFPFPLGTDLELRLRLDDTLLVLGKVVTCDPQVGNGIQFTRMLPEDIDELRAFLEATEKQE
jgi:PilZ domain-containing protein